MNSFDPRRASSAIRKLAAIFALSLSFALSRADDVVSASGSISIEARRELFAYDSHAGFAIEEKNVERRGGATVRDLSFLATPEKRIAAYVVAPADGPVRAAVLWVHWLGDAATSNRTEFLDEATALASHGVVSILVDTLWAKPRWHRERILEEDFKSSINQVIALRRALDLLASQPGATAVPFALVGHDYGGMYGAIVSGLEPRLKACVFIACTPSLLDWAFIGRSTKPKEEYLRENQQLELRDFLGATRATLLFQFAERDHFVPFAKAGEFFAAANSEKQMRVYGGARHAMNVPASIRQDRIAWLADELGLNRASASP